MLPSVSLQGGKEKGGKGGKDKGGKDKGGKGKRDPGVAPRQLPPFRFPGTTMTELEMARVSGCFFSHGEGWTPDDSDVVCCMHCHIVASVRNKMWVVLLGQARRGAAFGPLMLQASWFPFFL